MQSFLYYSRGQARARIRTLTVLIMDYSEKILPGALTQALLFCCLGLCHAGLLAAAVFPERLSLLDSIHDGRFQELENTLVSLQESIDAGTGDDRQLGFVLETLANSDPETEARLNEWIRLSPRSYAAYLVRAYYYYDVAWSWRGHGRREDTAGSRLRKMEEYLQLAADDLAVAIQIKPVLSAADALAIRILMMLGNQDYKGEIMREALRISPASYLVRAAYLWSLKPAWGGQAGELMQFVGNIGEAVQAHPHLHPLLGYADYIFADSLAEKSQFRQAVDHFDFAVDKGADHIVYRDRGINYYRLKEYENALLNFSRALELWPEDAEVLRWRSRVRQRNGDDIAALNDLELALKLAPMDRYVLMAHARLSRKLRRFDRILEHYQRALYYNSEDADIWFARAMHYSHELVDFEAAERDLQRATELDPGRTAYWYEYAAVLHYRLDCRIVTPLQHYLQLCDSGKHCRASELEWARHAQHWLEENERC